MKCKDFCQYCIEDDFGDYRCVNDQCPACTDYCPVIGEYENILTCKYASVNENVTYIEDFTNKFPDATFHPNGVPMICRMYLYGDCPNCKDYTSCYACWCSKKK